MNCYVNLLCMTSHFKANQNQIPKAVVLEISFKKQCFACYSPYKKSNLSQNVNFLIRKQHFCTVTWSYNLFSETKLCCKMQKNGNRLKFL